MSLTDHDAPGGRALGCACDHDALLRGVIRAAYRATNGYVTYNDRDVARLQFVTRPARWTCRPAT